ncbi:his operon leader peptide [Enterobacter sp. MW07]|nr:his operon leader peptide [Enterobacter sp. MW07]
MTRVPVKHHHHHHHPD